MKCSNLNWIWDKKIPYHITQKENVKHLRFSPFHFAGKPWCSELMKMACRNFKKVRNTPQINKKHFCYKKNLQESIAATVVWKRATFYHQQASVYSILIFSNNLFLWNNWSFMSCYCRRGEIPKSHKAVKFLFCHLFNSTYIYIKSFSWNKLVGSIAKKNQVNRRWITFD